MWNRRVELQAAACTSYCAADPPVVAQQMNGTVPMRPDGRMQEIPGPVACLLGDGASTITGIDVPIAGGIL